MECAVAGRLGWQLGTTQPSDCAPPPPFLRRLLFVQVLNRLTNESVQLLDVLGGSLAQLSQVTAPIHSRATALTAAQRNIAAAKDSVDKLLEHLDTSRRVSNPIFLGTSRCLIGERHCPHHITQLFPLFFFGGGGGAQVTCRSPPQPQWHFPSGKQHQHCVRARSQEGPPPVAISRPLSCFGRHQSWLWLWLSPPPPARKKVPSTIKSLSWL
jgi:hypothetical protein